MSPWLTRKTQTRLAGVMAAAALLFLFFVANRGAYEGYFQDDDLDNLSWLLRASPTDFIEGVVTPKFYPQNFRPLGHLYFFVLGRTAGLEFPWYVLVLHAVHLLNTGLMWLLLGRLGLPALARWAGALFFLFHMAVFDALWKPMYIFDVLCGAFCLASLLCWSHRRYVFSFAFFWLAYKSKEQAVMLPVVLAALEYWFGDRRWRRLAPFFLVALSFGLQGLFLNPHTEGDYKLSFLPGGLWKTVAFYSSQVFLVPYLGLVLVALPWVARDRRVWFGLAAMIILLVPMLLLPGRLFGAYFYVSLAGLAVTVAACAARSHPALIAAFFIIWLPYNYQELRRQRRAALTLAAENRAYVRGLEEVSRENPEIRRFLYSGSPETLRLWGIRGALRWFHGGEDVEVLSVRDGSFRAAVASGAVGLLDWDPATRTLRWVTRPGDTADAAYVLLNRLKPIWQLEEGWFPLEHNYRWIGPSARARLRRPAEAQWFELFVNAGPELMRRQGRVSVTVFLDGVETGVAEFTRPGWQKARWKAPASTEPEATVEFRVEPAFLPSPDDPRTLGIAVGGFGFIPPGPPPDSPPE